MGHQMVRPAETRPLHQMASTVFNGVPSEATSAHPWLNSPEFSRLGSLRLARGSFIGVDHAGVTRVSVDAWAPA